MEDALRAEDLLRNISLVRWYRVLIVGFAFSIPGMVPLWISSGLSTFEINVLQALFALTMFLWEVPSGYFADLSSRRKALTYGSAALAVGSAIYVVADSFYQYLTAEIVLGVGFSLISGADEALLSGSLEELGRKKEYEKLFGRIRSSEHIAAAISVAIGGFVCAYSTRLALVLAVPFFIVQLCCALRMTEPQREAKASSDSRHLGEILEVAKQCLVQSVELRWLFVYSAIVHALLQPVVWMYQPYLVIECGISTERLGLVWASFAVTAAIFSRNSALISSRASPLLSFGGALGIIATSYLLLGFWQGVWSFLFVLLHQAARGYIAVAVSTFLNHAVGDARRATSISLLGMCNRLLYAAMLLPIGSIVEVVGPGNGFRYLALMLSAVSIPLLLAMPFSLRRHKVVG